MTDEFRELLVLAYQGEVLGEELFGRVAAQREDEGERAKLLAVQQLEAVTKERVAAYVAELGVDCGDDEASRAAARQVAESFGSRTWSELMATLGPATESYRDAYAKLKSVAPDPDHPLLDALIRHEQALRSFSEAELAGSAGDSLAAIREVVGARL